MPFAFLLALGAVSVVVLALVDVDKSRVECRMYLVDEATRIYKLDPRGRHVADGGLEEPIIPNQPPVVDEDLRDRKA